jgi:hypothetical protein
LLLRLSEIFIDAQAADDMDRLVQRLFESLDALSALAARRDRWVESIPIGPVLSAAQEHIDRNVAACAAWAQQQTVLRQVERELEVVELELDPATKEAVMAKVQELKVAKKRLERAIMYDLPEAKGLEANRELCHCNARPRGRPAQPPGPSPG